VRNRIGELWFLGTPSDWKSPKHSQYCILVTESIEKGNGRTLQRYIYFRPDKTKGGSGEDTEYSDLPWEHRKERTRLG
jgi:hypothetical protein